MTASRPAQGPRALGSTLAKLTRPIYRRRGFAHGEVLAHWPAIVGEFLAAATCPEKLIFPTGAGANATLQVRVAPGFATDMQHLTPIVIERINAFYGYRAIARLKLVQGPLAPQARPRQRQIRALTPEQECALTRTLASTRDATLRSALAGLGRSVRGVRMPET